MPRSLFLMFLTQANPYKFAMSTIGGHSLHRDGELFESQKLWCPPERLPD
jgi:hypothetical protein